MNVKGSAGIALIAIVWVAGCGGPEGPTTVPVSGTIYLDGEPLADAEVHFLSENFAAAGMTDADGRFELIQGAVPGENLVYVTKVVGEPLPGDPAVTGIDEYQLELACRRSGNCNGGYRSGGSHPSQVQRSHTIEDYLRCA